MQVTQRPILPAHKIAQNLVQKFAPLTPKFLLNPFPAFPVSPPSEEPMECESVAAVELTREIEEVIESPVREDMMARNSAADADDKRNDETPSRNITY